MASFATDPLVLSDTQRINTYASGDQLLPRVAVLNDGGHVVIWYSSGQDGSGYGVYQQRYDAAGNPVGGEARVNTYTTNDQYDSAVTALTNGGYVVTWASTGEDGSGGGIYARRYNADGSATSVFRVNTTTTNNQFAPDIGSLTGGGFAIAFTHEVTPGSNQNVFVRIYKPDGTAAANPVQVNQYTSSFQTYAAVAGGANGHALAVWQSNNQDGGGYGI